MKTKLDNPDYPYITSAHPIFKIISDLFSKNFTSGFSTGYHLYNLLYINGKNRLSTYQQLNNHHQISNKYLYLYIIIF